MNGILKIVLVDARGLKDTDLIGKMDPYVMIRYKDQKLKSKVAKGQGSNPEWNDEFSVWVQYPGEGDDYSLVLKIMDEDIFTDDLIGEVKIDLKDLIVLGAKKGSGELEPKHYNVIGADNIHYGEIRVAFALSMKDNQMTKEKTEEGP
ncbi:hypothetical protein ACHQM5_021309 [Ranunculus cassubicifolius]